MIQARLTLGLIPPEEVPELMAQLMAEGATGDALAELAIFPSGAGHSPALREIQDLLPLAYQELGLKSMSGAEAARIVARDLAREIAGGITAAFQGAATIYEICRDFEELQGELDYMGFYGLLHATDDDEEHRYEYVLAILDKAHRLATGS